MLQTLKALKNERVVNIKELQKSPSKHLKGITRIMRGKKTLGHFLDAEALGDLIEDVEALNSPKFLKSIRESRARNKTYSLEYVKKRYGLSA